MGNGGISLESAIFCSKNIGDRIFKLFHGGSAVSICRTVPPSDHMSALIPWPVSKATSGAKK